jgi:hypothetical protein
VADEVSDGQQTIGRGARIVLNAVWWLLPVSSRPALWGDFYETYRSPQQLMRKTLKVIWGAVRSQTEEPYYPGMALVQTLAISASLLGTLTPLSAGIVAGAVSAGLLIRDVYMDPAKKGYACFLWDSVTAIALLVVLQAFYVPRWSGHLAVTVLLIAAQSVAGGASASFFRLIFKMPRDPLQRLFEDYQDTFHINVLWCTACIALLYTTVTAVSLSRMGSVLIFSQCVAAALLIRLPSDRLGGVAAPHLMSLRVHPVQQKAQIKTGSLPQPPETLQGRLLEIGFFVVTAAPFAIALWLWWTKQDTGIEWGEVRANAGSLVILSIFWIRIRALNAETVEALDQKVKEKIKALEKPPEKTDHDA